ncbi:MAG: response regulator transcription factor [Myxococcales bacterium]|nr:response regulator transcription factor [Myxococcales bacterium]
MASYSILVVEDEEDILELLRYNLQKEGYTVVGVVTGEAGIARARNEPPDLVVLDVMLPGMDGFDVCRVLRSDARTKAVPIIMLTAKGEDTDVVAGLELGADDYVTKPFSPRVLIARIRRLLRQKAEVELDDDDKKVLARHSLVVDPVRFEVRVDGEAIELTATEFGILHFLARRPGWVFTRDRIISGVKGDNYNITERTVDVQIAGIRKKLGRAGRLIETVRGVGYRFKE